jgi:hypothetical protein
MDGNAIGQELGDRHGSPSFHEHPPEIGAIIEACIRRLATDLRLGLLAKIRRRSRP